MSSASPRAWRSGLAALAAVSCLAAVSKAQFQAYYLSKDINTTAVTQPAGDFYPSYARTTQTGAERHFLKLGSAIYFAGTTYATGYELWKFDGVKVTLVKDIMPGASSSSPSNLIVVGTKLYFVASGPSKGREIWESDGTAAGTKLFADVEPGSGSSNPYNLAPLTGGRIVFTRYTSTNGTELWMTNGTTSAMLKDIRPGTSSSSPSYLRSNAAMTRVFFRASDGTNGYEPWVTDGTATGTIMLANCYYGSGSGYPGYFQPLGATKVVFSAYTRPNSTTSLGTELWVSDGTTAGTQLVKDIYTGPSSGTDLYTSVPFGGKVLFEGRSIAGGYELWITDGTAAGTTQVKDLAAGSGSAYIYDMVLSGGKVYFSNRVGTAYQVYTTNGTSAGTVLVGTGFPSSVSNLCTVGSRVLGSCYKSGSGTEPWIAGGTSTTATMLKELYSGSGSGYCSYGTEVLPGVTAFRGRTNAEGDELVVTKGTAATTAAIDTNKWTFGTVTASENIGQMTSRFGSVLFTATDGTGTGKHGQELWATKGGSTTTALVKDVRTGTLSGLSSYSSSFCRLGNKVFFAANDGSKGTELWSSDGTTTGTALVKDIYVGAGSSNPRYLTRVGDTIYFQAYVYGKGTELWKTDGTAAGTVMVKDIYSGSSSSSPSYFCQLGNKVLFRAYGGYTGGGYELYVTDGTATGTARLKDIRVGSSSSYPSYLTNVGGKVYFSANGGTNGTELWVTDGTATGTVMVKDIYTGSLSSSPRYLCEHGGLLWFRAYTPTGGYELWRSNGTSAGTVQVANFSTDLNPAYLTSVGARRIFMSGNWGTAGYEPGFVTIGTSLSFSYVNYGALSSNPYNYTEGVDKFALDSGRVFTRGYMNPSSDQRIFRMDNGATAHPIGEVRGKARLSATKDPILNTTTTLQASTTVANPLHVLVLGGPNANPQFVAPNFYAYNSIAGFMILGAGAGANFNFPLPIPNDSTLKGVKVVIQDWALNAATFPSGWALSNGLFLVLGTS